MKKITVPSTVTTIRQKALNGSQATSLVLPKSVNKVIEDWMFYGDATVYFHGMKPKAGMSCISS